MKRGPPAPRSRNGPRCLGLVCKECKECRVWAPFKGSLHDNSYWGSQCEEGRVVAFNGIRPPGWLRALSGPFGSLFGCLGRLILQKPKERFFSVKH